MGDDRPDLVVIQVYITSARRSYEIADHYRARGVHVAIGGLHVTSLPDEAAAHADTIFLGPGEDTWPVFLARLPSGAGRAPAYTVHHCAPSVRCRRSAATSSSATATWCPNSIVVSRGCPHHCDFCYKDAFFDGGKSFYTQTVDAALAEIERLPGRHLYFLDDHLFGNRRFAEALFDGMAGMGRRVAGGRHGRLDPRPRTCWSGRSSAGLRSLFVGFETVNGANLAAQRKRQNVGRDYAAVVRRLHDAGVMVNASFVFGMDGDGPDVFDRTVDWAVEPGHRDRDLPHHDAVPGHRPVPADGGARAGSLHRDWDLLRHPPRRLRPPRMTAGAARGRVLAGVPRLLPMVGAIWRGAATKPVLGDRLRHLAYAGGWKKFEPVWDVLIRSGQVLHALPLLEATLGSFGARRPRANREAPRPGLRARPAAPTRHDGQHGPPVGRARAFVTRRLMDRQRLSAKSDL